MTLDELIALCRARKMADRYEDRYPDDGANAADDKHQREKEGD